MGEKYLVVTDIHGSGVSAELIVEKFNRLGCDKIVILGDILYHGPRNDIPNGYDPKRVINILNQYVDKIIAVKGNCDAEVDEMVLDFPLQSKIDMIINGKRYIFEHGHHLEIKAVNRKYSQAIVMYGHTHVNKVTHTHDATYINLASITIPKDNCPPSYAIIDDTGVKVYDMADNVITHMSAKK